MRFAGSREAKKATPVSRSGQTPDFEPMVLKSAGARSNAASAADAVSTSSLYGAMKSAPDYGEISTTAMANRAAERISAAQAEGRIAMAGIEAQGQIQAAEAKAEAMRAQGKAAEKGGMFSALGGIASAAVGLLSDERTKHTIEEIEDALSTLRELRPVTYYYKEEYTDTPNLIHNGFIAQEYGAVIPQGVLADLGTGLLSINTQEVIALLVRGIQQLEERVKELENK